MSSPYATQNNIIPANDCGSWITATSRMESPCSTTDRTWKSSQGIRFRVAPSPQGWHPSQHIVFSDPRPNWDLDYSTKHGKYRAGIHANSGGGKRSVKAGASAPKTAHHNPPSLTYSLSCPLPNSTEPADEQSHELKHWIRGEILSDRSEKVNTSPWIDLGNRCNSETLSSIDGRGIKVHYGSRKLFRSLIRLSNVNSSSTPLVMWHGRTLVREYSSRVSMRDRRNVGEASIGALNIWPTPKLAHESMQLANLSTTNNYTHTALEPSAAVYVEANPRTGKSASGAVKAKEFREKGESNDHLHTSANGSTSISPEIPQTNDAESNNPIEETTLGLVDEGQSGEKSEANYHQKLTTNDSILIFAELPEATNVGANPPAEGTVLSAIDEEKADGQNNEARYHQYLSPLGYRIPIATMKEAELAPPGTMASYWQYTLYRGPQGEKPKVHYCKSKETTERIAQLFLGQEILGFDIEWKPQAHATEGIKKNVALIQLASEERIALFHVGRYREDEKTDDLVAPTLKRIMESPDITKVGVSIKADCTRLRKFMGIHSNGLFELSHLYKVVKHSQGNVKLINKMLANLAQQVQEHLHLPLWKGEVRSGDWSKELNAQQVYYAASDSYAGFQLYHVLEGKRKALVPTPPRPSHAEKNLPIRLANGQTVADYDDGLDLDCETPTDSPPDPSISLEEIARDFLNISLEDPSPSLKPTQEAPWKLLPLPAPEVTAANEWIFNWRGTLPSNYKVRASQAQLRAYALWHCQNLDLSEVASLLRDPPLKQATVASYVLDAVRLEKLPYAGKQTLDEVLVFLPKAGRAKHQHL